MPIKISLAKTPEQIEALMRVRYKVFSEEEGLFVGSDEGLIMDRFDAYPSTYNLVVEADGEVVGGMRMTLDSGAGVPADEFYDFRAHIPPGSSVLSLGMYCVTKAYRSHHLALGLMSMASYFGMSHQVTHVVAPINPLIARLISRVGFKKLSADVVHHNGLEALPMLLDVRNISCYFAHFVETNNLHNLIGSYECLFYRKGEYVLHLGEHADSAFVIVGGEIEVLDPHSGEVLATMREGEIFGELALFTDDVRAADVVASSDLRIMSLPKLEFLDHLRSHPESAMHMLERMGTRLRGMLTH